MTRIIVIGGGGHCRSCIDVIEAENLHQIAGIIQPTVDGEADVMGYPVIASDQDLALLRESYTHAFIGIGQIKTASVRQQKFDVLCDLGYELVSVISPHAYVSPHSSMGRGSIIMHHAVVNAGAVVGDNCIVNNLALVEHDVVVGKHCHISTGARVNGGVRIGEGSFVGSGSVIKHGVAIGAGAVIGAGLTVLKDVPSGVVMGKPDA